MSISSAYKAEAERVTVMLGGATFELRHHDVNGIPYSKTMRELTKPFKRTLAGGASLPVEKERELSVTAFVKCTLIGWTNLREEDGGDEVPYSEGAAIELLLKYPRLYGDLVAEASDFEQFRRNDAEAIAKN